MHRKRGTNWPPHGTWMNVLFILEILVFSFFFFSFVNFHLSFNSEFYLQGCNYAWIFHSNSTHPTLNPPTFSAQPAQLINATFLYLVTAQSNVSCITIKKKTQIRNPQQLIVYPASWLWCYHEKLIIVTAVPEQAQNGFSFLPVCRMYFWFYVFALLKGEMEWGTATSPHRYSSCCCSIMGNPINIFYFTLVPCQSKSVQTSDTIYEI